MKAKIISLILGIFSVAQIAFAQTTNYKMNVKMTDGSFFSVAADDVEEVYFTTTTEKHFTDTYYIVSGKAEKGPFRSGASVTLQPLDISMNAYGTTLTSMTFDDCGSYSFRNTLFKYPYVLISATGLFYNEYDDYKTRETQLTLQGYADLQRSSKVNLNAVTHIICGRIENLILGGLDFEKAFSRAQDEFLSIFGLQRLNNKDFSQVSLTDGDDYASALLAISMPLLYYRNGADLISWLTKLRYDFADDGHLTDQNKAQFNKDRNHISLSYDTEKLVKKYKEYGVDVSFKDLKTFYDWDNDGVAGNEIYDPSQPVTYDVTNINAPMDGGTYTVNVNCNVPLYTSPLSSDDVPQSTNPYVQFIADYMDVASDYKNGVWTIKINPARYRHIGDVTLKLYDAVGNIVVSIKLTQEGNPEGEFLQNEGVALVTRICSALAIGHSNYKYADSDYTGLTDNHDFKAPLDPYNSRLEDLFTYSYQTINYANQMVQSTSYYGIDLFNPLYTVVNGLMYYELITHFGDVPFVKNIQEEYYRISRTSSNEIFNYFISSLIAEMEKMDDVKAGYIDSANDIAIPPKDLARLILADIYLYQGKYEEAKELLTVIVNSNRYGLVSEIGNLNKECAEIVWGMPNINGTTRAYEANDICIIKTYSDVILSLAECECMLGNNSKAMELVNMVSMTKGIETTSSNVISAIAEIRSKIQIDFGGYFAFLKRTGLAKSMLNLQDYQLLFPIPQRQINMNPSISQNPGYDG